MSTTSEGQRLDRFLDFSAVATAFTVFELRGTGMAADYLAVVDRVVGMTVTDQLLDAHDRVTTEAAGPNSAAVEDLLRREILSDPTLGPVARNVAKMWYVGIWYALPSAWVDVNGARPADGTFTVSATAYTEGLLWPAIGASPPGAKPPGFGTWAGPPRIPVCSSAAPAS
jgi:hypothetical protein